MGYPYPTWHRATRQNRPENKRNFRTFGLSKSVSFLTLGEETYWLFSTTSPSTPLGYAIRISTGPMKGLTSNRCQARVSLPFG